MQPNSPETLNIIANGLKDFPRPSSMKYITPPWISPWSSFPRYISASVHVKNLVLIPNIAVTHIQNTAPGPPVCIATATPAIFPIPTVPANALDNASKWVIWPGSSSESYLPSNISIPCLKYNIGTKRLYPAKNIPPPSRSITSGVPQRKPARLAIAVSSIS